MVEITKTIEIEFDGKINLNLNLLDEDIILEILAGCVNLVRGESTPTIDIPLTFSFEHEVTLEIEPIDLVY